MVTKCLGGDSYDGRKIIKNVFSTRETKKSRSSRFEAKKYSGGLSKKRNKIVSRVWMWGAIAAAVTTRPMS